MIVFTLCDNLRDIFERRRYDSEFLDVEKNVYNRETTFTKLLASLLRMHHTHILQNTQTHITKHTLTRNKTYTLLEKVCYEIFEMKFSKIVFRSIFNKFSKMFQKMLRH